MSFSLGSLEFTAIALEFLCVGLRDASFLPTTSDKMEAILAQDIIMGYDTDPDNEDPVETDSGCKAAGSGQFCQPSHPGGGLIRGKRCRGNKGGPNYIYCHIYAKKRSKYRKAACRIVECIQVDQNYVVCGETS